MSVGELEDRIAAKLEVHTPSAFGLFEIALSEEERSVPSSFSDLHGTYLTSLFSSDAF
jgi:hypothetical protein